MPINAGIGWATVKTFIEHGVSIAEAAKPSFIVVALGTNDALRGQLDGFAERYANLLNGLSRWPTMAVPLRTSIAGQDKFNAAIERLSVAKADIPPAVGTLGDGVHMATNGYRSWLAGIRLSAERAFCKQ